MDMDIDIDPTEMVEEKPSRLSEYFANKPSDEIVDLLNKKIQDYYKFLNATGKLARWEKSYAYYYGMDLKGNSAVDISYKGEQGELSSLRVNHYRSLNQSLLTLTTSAKQSYETRSINSDTRSRSSQLVASSLLDFYETERGFGEAKKDTAEYNLIFDFGYLYSPWNDQLGDPSQADLQRGVSIKDGDIDFSAKTPLEVIVDTRNRSPKQPWYIVKGSTNRYNLAAENPDIEDEILSLGKMSRQDVPSFLIDNSSNQESDSDTIEYWEFWHEKTSACPAGRFVKFVGDLVLDSATLDELDYDEAPISRMAASKQVFTPFGYSNTLDLLAIQELLDSLYSIVATNQLTNGVGSVASEKGSGFKASQLASGLNHFEVDAGSKYPEAVNFTATPAEIFNFISMLEAVMEKIVGVSSTLRGDAPTQYKSGAALAMVAAQSQMLLGNLNNSFDDLFEEVGGRIFKILQRKAARPRAIAIAGKFNEQYMGNFSSKDIAHVSRIIVDRGNWQNKTAQGRMALAEALQNNAQINGVPLTNQEFLSVISSGKLEPLIEAPVAKLMAIKAENEALQQGEQVIVLPWEDHKLHREEHLTVLASPEAKKNPDLVTLVMAHLDAHDAQEEKEAEINRQRSIRLQGPPPMGQPGQPPVPGQPQQPQLPQGIQPPEEIQDKAASVRMPSLPQGTPPQLEETYSNMIGPQ